MKQAPGLDSHSIVQENAKSILIQILMNIFKQTQPFLLRCVPFLQLINAFFTRLNVDIEKFSISGVVILLIIIEKNDMMDFSVFSEMVEPTY